MGTEPPHAPLQVPSHPVLDAACTELTKRTESGIEATTIRRLIFINASSDSRSHVTRDLTRGRRTDKERGVRLFRSSLQETPALISIPRSEGVYTGTAISHERALVQRSSSNLNRT